MTMSRTGTHRCRVCGRQLTDATSRAFGIGPECRRGMTAEQLRAALLDRARQDDPFRIPGDRPPSPVARRNNAIARAIIAQARAPESARCHHGGTPGACPECRREADPTRAAERIIREIRAERRAARDAAYRARLAQHQQRPA